MRKICNSIMLVAAAAMAFASCQKEIATLGSISTTLTLHAGVESTKTYLGEDNTVLWGPDEVVKLYVGSGEEAKFISSTKTSDFNGSSTASFTFSIDGVTESDSYTLGGVYPASISEGINSNNNPVAYKVQLPATQNSVNGGYDPKAYMMVIRPEKVSELPEEFEGYFRRATALNKVTLTNVAEDITSVEISVPEKKYLAGRRNINLTTGESGEIYDSGTQTNVVKVTGDFKVNEGVIDVWFCSWEVELDAGDVLSVKLSSDKNTYTHSVTLKDDESIKFKEGYLNTLSVNMEDAEVETLSTITGKYLIASKTSSGWFLMTPTNGGKFYTATSSVSSASEVTCDDFYEVTGVDDYVWEVAKYDNAYSIMSTSTNKYVAFSGSGNEAYANDALSDVAKMDIQLEGQSAVIESVKVAGRKLQYNASSPRFAFYTTNQTPVYMIPWVPDATPRIFVNEAEYDVQASEGVVDIVYSTNSYVVDDIKASVKTGATMNISSVTVDTDKVIVNYAENTESESKTATIVLSYNGAESKEVVINQAPAKTGGAAPSGTVLWSENWGTYTGSVANYKFTGTTVYGGSTANLAYSVDNTNDKIESQTANPIKSNNLFFYKSAASSWTVQGIDLAGATSVTLKYTVNRTNIAVYYSVDGGAEKQLNSNSSSGVNTKTISNLSGSTLKLRFNKTGTSQNCRIDDISVTVN